MTRRSAMVGRMASSGRVVGTAPTITTSVINNMNYNSSFSQTITATGSGTITYSVTSGSLPGGLSLASGGAITGTPTVYGAYSFTVRASNSAGHNDKLFAGTGWNAILLPPSGMTVYNFSTLSASLGHTDVAYVAAHMPGAGCLYLDIPGTYTWSDFAVAVDAPDCFALGVYGSNCKSILGSTANPADTVLQMNHMSSTFPTGDIPPDTPSGPTNNIVAVRVPQLGNLTLDITDQGHFFNGFQVISDDSPSTAARLMDNLVVRGWSGDTNNEPGETAGIAVNTTHGTSGTVYHVGPNVEVNGIRISDGALVGASPFEFNSSSFVTFDAPPTGSVDAVGARAGIYLHDTLASMPTMWNSTDIVWNDLNSQRCGSGTGLKSGTGANLERSTRITFNTTNIVLSSPATLDFQHFQINSDTENSVVTINGVTFNNPAYDPTHLTFYIGATYGSGQQVTGANITVNGTAITGSPTPAIAVYH